MRNYTKKRLAPRTRTPENQARSQPEIQGAGLLEVITNHRSDQAIANMVYL